MTHRLFIAFLLVLLPVSCLAADPPVRLGDSRRLVYTANERGDRVPDFSTCGYAGGDRQPPQAVVRVVIPPTENDNTAAIQAGIDRVSSLPADERGIRGAVMLSPGEHRVAGTLRIRTSGVVLRGAGADDTKLVATGVRRSPLIRIAPAEQASIDVGEAFNVTDAYVPVGATRFTLGEPGRFSVGDSVLIHRPSTDEWIAALNARVEGVGWRAGRCDIRWERKVTAVEGDQIILDAPLTTALDSAFGTATVAKVDSNSRVREIGVEDLTLRSETVSQNPVDEEHSWHGVVVDGAEDAWVRRVRFQGFAGGAVLLNSDVRRTTVSDCLSLEPVSELGGYRRQTFFTQGQQTLFIRCWSEEGINDFSVGHCAAGPNAFVNCYASRANGDSGPLESWASGVLYDNVRIDGADLFFGNRWSAPPGVGWSAANCVAWQCQAAELHCFSPPTAQNWALGFWARPLGDGELHGLSDFLKPISLYRTQLIERRGDAAEELAGEFLLDPVASTSPTQAQARAFVESTKQPRRTLRDLIEANLAAAQVAEGLTHENTTPTAADQTEGLESREFGIKNGWIVCGDEVVTGGWHNPTWWRGTVRPQEAPAFGASITRYAPGRYGTGLTDELGSVINRMKRRGVAVYDHHYGLWYDRRRDDHLMVRRAAGKVAPPFYEQPFARTGQGTAWDGLSKYDLTQFNPWYWSRLSDFAELAESEGVVLSHQCYFQHNILEAGAHWADCPWRPANNVNRNGLSEPPPYVGDKRVWIAHQFYDTQNAELLELHRGYLRKCVASFAERSNVIQFTSAEYTGPLEFTRFWLDTVSELHDKLGAGGLIGLSTTKDVQDTILSDGERESRVDVIDIRYWCYDRQGGLYAPPGGANMAPRQHMRQMRSAGGDFASVSRAVREYRLQHPEKAVTFTANRFCRTPAPGWAVLMAGGSLAAVPPLPKELKRGIAQMRPVESPSSGLHQLLADDGSSLVYAEGRGERLTLPSGTDSERFEVSWINPDSGDVTGNITVSANSETTMTERVAWVRPL